MFDNPPKFNSSPLNKLPGPKKNVVFQPLFFRGEMLNFGGVFVFPKVFAVYFFYHLKEYWRKSNMDPSNPPFGKVTGGIRGKRLFDAPCCDWDGFRMK